MLDVQPHERAASRGTGSREGNNASNGGRSVSLLQMRDAGVSVARRLLDDGDGGDNKVRCSKERR